jgi:hypothetical protein
MKIIYSLRSWISLKPFGHDYFYQRRPVRIFKANEQPDEGRVMIIDASEGPLTQVKLIHHVS